MKKMYMLSFLGQLLFGSYTSSAQTSFTITSDYTVTNKSSLVSFSGSVSNFGSYTSTGTDYFIGTSNQTISGNFSGSNYFGDLKKMNQGKILATCDITTKTLDFLTAGSIDVGAHQKTLFVTSSSPSAIVHSGSLRFVDVGNSRGFLKRNIYDTLPNSWYLFPVGNSVAGYLPLSFQITNRNLDSGPITVTLHNGSPGSINYSRFFSTGFSPTAGTCNPGSAGRSVSFDCLRDHYWNTSGPSKFQYITRSETNGCGIDLRRIIKYPWDSIESTIGSVPQNLCQYSDWSGNAPSIPGGIYQGFSRLAVAGRSSTTLPVVMSPLIVRALNNHFIRIEWKTFLEIANRGFHLYRFSDQSPATEIYFHPSLHESGNSTVTTDYNYDDYAITSGTYYYYLIQEDVDGAHHYSETRSATLHKNSYDVGTDISIYPNPCTDYITITIQDSTSNEMFLYSPLGEKITTLHLTGLTALIPMHQYASGTYILCMKNKGAIRRFSIIKH